MTLNHAINPVPSTVLLFTILMVAPLSAAESGQTEEKFSWSADLRYRFEHVDENGFSEQAEASTLRTRLSFSTPRKSGVKALVEVSNVRAIGPDDYNAGAGATPDRTNFPVIADAEDSRLNRAWLSWTPSEDLEIRAGRQRIKLDNDRFIGNVGWRQNEQTYDSATVRLRRNQWSLFYGWVDGVNRIFSTDTAAGRHDHRTHLLRLSRNLADDHELVAYGYHVDDREQPALSNRTVGLRYTGRTKDATVPMAWQLEGAVQREAGQAPEDYSARYFHAQLLASPHPGIRPFIGFERLGGNRTPGNAFRTPLATLHAFNGWADRFLATPDDGLDDWYAGFRGGSGRLDWQLAVHRFQADVGDTDFGREVDASLSVRLHESASILIKAARFDADAAGFRSVTKFWTMLNFRLP